MRRNSLLPLIGIIVVAALCLWMINPGEVSGQGGPGLEPGILRLPKNTRHRIVPVPLVLDQQVEVVERGTPPPGIEPGSWRVVSVVAEDDQPITRAVVLGLAEWLTERGAVAVVGVSDQQLTPIPPDRVLRVATLEGGVVPDHPGAPFTVAIAVRQSPTCLPKGHPGADLQGASGIQELAFRIRHHSTCGEPGVAWPTWWAAVGHAVSDPVLEQLVGGSELMPEWDRLAPVEPSGRWLPLVWLHPAALWFLLAVPIILGLRTWAVRRLSADHPARTNRWRRLRPWLGSALVIIASVVTAEPRQIPRTVIRPLEIWSTHLPITPHLEVLRWHTCFQDDLVRGWIGRIQGTTTTDRHGQTISALKPLVEFITKRLATDETVGAETTPGWREESGQPEGRQLYVRDRQEIAEFFLIQAREGGWDCSQWQERSRPATEHQRWLDAIDEDDLEERFIARQRLRRHLAAGRIPEDQRAEALALLRREPDAAEVALIGEQPEATEGERRFAQACRYVMVGAEAPPTQGGDDRWALFTAGNQATLPGQSILCQVREVLVLVMIGPHGGEIVARGADGFARAPVDAEGLGALVLPGGGSVSLGKGPVGPVITVH